MKVYDLLYNAEAPAGIEDRRAYIVGGGIGGLTAAALLITDAHLPAQNVTIIEASDVVGGSMDGTGNAVDGYLCRGERELEPYMETLWYVCSKVPSLRHPGRTILDDVHDFNREMPLFARQRIFEKQGRPVDYHDFTLDDELLGLMTNLLNAPEEEREGVSIEEYFPERFFESNLWWTFHPMLAFKEYHSAIECKRYFRRFTHFAPQSDYLIGILHTDLNEYDALIKPIVTWLADQGVQMRTGTAVTDIVLTPDNNTVTGIEVWSDGTSGRIEVAASDLVFFTNGSMTTNTGWGTKDTVAPTNYDTSRRGVFSVWEELAARDPKFGNPATFIDDVDATKWVSFFPTITAFPALRQAVEEMSGVPWGTGGIITIRDSAWELSLIPHHTPFFPDQPDDVDVFWPMGCMASASATT